MATESRLRDQAGPLACRTRYTDTLLEWSWPLLSSWPADAIGRGDFRHGELAEDARVGVVKRRDESSEHMCPFHVLGFHHVFFGHFLCSCAYDCFVRMVFSKIVIRIFVLKYFF